jgi:hypothetical protein
MKVLMIGFSEDPTASFRRGRQMNPARSIVVAGGAFPALFASMPAPAEIDPRPDLGEQI